MVNIHSRGCPLLLGVLYLVDSRVYALGRRLVGLEIYSRRLPSLKRYEWHCLACIPRVFLSCVFDFGCVCGPLLLFVVLFVVYISG